MGTLAYILQRVHSKWDGSIQARTNPGETVETIQEILDEVVTELNLSSQSWLVPRFTVQVEPGQDTYPVAGYAASVGRLQMVIAVSNSGTTDQRSRVVDTVDEPQLYGYYHGGDSGPSGVELSAEAACLIHQNGVTAIKFAPIPEAAGEYLVIYEPAQVRPTGKNSTAFRLPQFDGYIADRAAFKGLPYQKWEEFVTMSPGDQLKANESRRQQIRPTLEAEISRGDLRFRRFRQSDRQTDTLRSRPFGARRWARRR